MKEGRNGKAVSLIGITVITVTVIAILLYALVFNNHYENFIDGISGDTVNSGIPFLDSPLDTINNTPDKAEDEEKIEEQVKAEIPNLRQKISGGLYEEANSQVKLLLAKSPQNPELINILDSSQNLVEFIGTVEHIFFHPLIAYPDRAFKGSQAKGEDDFMVTIYEFKKVLEEVHKRGYILVDLMDLYNVEYNQAGGVVKVTPNKLMLPEGKKPLVISIDDLNYYEYMIKDGQVSKLMLDNNGEVETYSVDENGNDVYSKDNEVVPILDEYVKSNPDFSFNGAKGTINLTGYEGVLGYRTNSLKYANFESERAEALKVIEQLKKTGWSFASHSQGHRHFAKISYGLAVEDTDRFAAEIEPLIGKTPIFVYPYGEQVPPNDPKFQYFQSKGFGIFCGVTKYPGTKLGGNYVIMNRRDVDGIALRDNRNNALYEAKDVIDPARPWYNDIAGSSSQAATSNTSEVNDFNSSEAYEG